MNLVTQYHSAKRAIFWSEVCKWFWRTAVYSCVAMAGYATTWWLLQLIQQK